MQGVVIFYGAGCSSTATLLCWCGPCPADAINNVRMDSGRVAAATAQGMTTKKKKKNSNSEFCVWGKLLHYFLFTPLATGTKMAA